MLTLEIKIGATWMQIEENDFLVFDETFDHTFDNTFN
jgi:hypothetical protein